MDIVTGEASRDLFGGEVPERVREVIDAAREAPRDSVGSILRVAMNLEPECLPVYYLLYKFHAGRGELELADAIARAGLAEAGKQAGLPQTLEAATTRYADTGFADFSQAGPARFWLFTLKALAFICVRRGEVREARRLLDLLERHDPTHSVGSEVTLALVEAATES